MDSESFPPLYARRVKKDLLNTGSCASVPAADVASYPRKGKRGSVQYSIRRHGLHGLDLDWR
jgi:hypothetical protein